jgi:hypothetical protein
MSVTSPGMGDVFRRLFTDICYGDRSKADSASAGWVRSILDKVGLYLPWGKELKLAESFRRRMGEGFFRTVPHSALSMSGARVTPERHVGLGRIGLLAVCGDLAFWRTAAILPPSGLRRSWLCHRAEGGERSLKGFRRSLGGNEPDP